MKKYAPSVILGCFDAIRKRNSKCLSYEGPGYWGISTLKPKSTFVSEKGGYNNSKYPQDPQKPEADFYHVNVIPVEPLLAILKDPEQFASMLEKKGHQVIAEYLEVNKNVRNSQDRVLAEKQFVVQHQTFRGNRGGTERSEVEFILTTYAYNLAAQKVRTTEPLLLRDVKASSVHFILQYLALTTLFLLVHDQS